MRDEEDEMTDEEYLEFCKKHYTFESMAKVLHITQIALAKQLEKNIYRKK